MEERRSGIECLGYRPVKSGRFVLANVDILLVQTRLVLFDCTLWQGDRGREVRLPSRWQKADSGGRWVKMAEWRSDQIAAAFSAQAVAAVDRYLQEQEQFR